MATNITYLLGAGASVNCLPIYKRRPKSLEISLAANNMPNIDLTCFDERLKYFCNHQLYELSSKYNWSKRPLPNYLQSELKFETYRDVIQIIIKILSDIINELNYHTSIDTIAKKLWHTKGLDSKLKLHELKAAISAFFCFMQILEAPDLRYDNFIATTLNNYNELPKNVKIINWNYDFQFELAATRYYPKLDTNGIANILQSFPLNSNYFKNFNNNKFGIINLNSKAGIMRYKQEESVETNSKTEERIMPFFNLYDSNEENKLLNVLKNFTNCYLNKNLISDYFCFSWENTEIGKIAMECAKEVLSNTQTLIVIGYSFPNFNSETDSTLLNIFNNNTIDSKRVIIQSPDAEKIKSLLTRKYINDVKIINFELEFSTSQFVIE